MSLEDRIQAIAPIPANLLPLLLPVDPALTLFHLFNFPLPPCEHVAALLPDHQIAFSRLSCTRFHNKATADTRLLQQLPLLPRPSLESIVQSAIDASHAGPIMSFTYPVQHALHDQLGPFDSLPLWVLSYWVRVYSIMSRKYDWAALLARVGGLGGNSGTLERLPWDLPLPGLGSLAMVAHVTDLLAFGDRSWLASRHIDLMLYTIASECNDTGLAFIDTTAFDTLWKVFRQNRAAYPSGAHPSLPLIGSKFHELRKVVLVVSVRVDSRGCTVSGMDGVVGNHWISVVIDREQSEIRHYDSMGGKPPVDLCAVLNWWLAMHGVLLYTHECKPCTRQQDTWSCGVLCVNALAHDVQPVAYPLLEASECERARIWLLEGILCYIHRFDHRFPSVPFRISLKAPTPSASDSAAHGSGSNTHPHPSPKPKPRPKARSKLPTTVHTKGSGSKSGGVKAKRKTVEAAVKPTLKIAFKKVTVPGTTSSSTAKRKWDETWGGAGPTDTPAAHPPSAVLPATGEIADAPLIPAPDMQEPAVPPEVQPDSTDFLEPIFDADDDADNWLDDPEAGDDVPKLDVRSYNRSELIDIAVKKPSKRKGGRPPDPLLNAITRRCCVSTDERRKPIFRCAGDPENDKWCGVTYANNNRKRWFKHGMTCTKLPAVLRRKVLRETAKWAPSERARAAIKKAEESSEAAHSEPASKALKASSKQSAGSSKLHDAARAAGCVARHAALDEAILLFFCIAGISLHIIELDVFKRILYLADHTYRLASREKLEYEHIQGEAAVILQRQIDLLKEKEFLTISYDGGTANNSRRQAFWTCHITTADGETYLMEVRDATDVSHTAEWIKGFVLEIIDEIGRDKFGGSVCDSTGNTRGSRPLLVIDVPTLLALADVCHHLSNTSKDIAKLPYFDFVIKGVRAVIAKFHRSHKATALLERERVKCKIPRGLESIGKTRFLTTYRGAISVERCAEPIRYIVLRNEIEGCEEFEDYFQGHLSTTTFHFQKVLSNFIAIGTPLLRALTCLEAVGANAADVYILWHAALREIEGVVHDKQRGIPVETRELIIGILNHRHKQLFGDDGTLASPIYLACAYLHPELLKNSLFKDEDRAKYTGEHWTAIRYPHLFEKVYKFIFDVAVNEIRHGSRAQLTQWRGRASEFKSALISELRMYSRMQYPYNTPLLNTQDIKTWWRSINELPYAKILPILALKLFSIRVNSMPEERTVSAFTWMTSPVRNRLHLNTLAAMSTIRQYHQTQRAKETRKTTPPRPLVRFQDVPKSPARSSASDVEDDDSVDWEWADDDEEDSDATPATELDVSCSGADMDSPYIMQALVGSDDALGTTVTPTKSSEQLSQPDAPGVAIDSKLFIDDDFAFDPTDLCR